MDDLISRQAAINAMCELMRHWFGGDPKDEVREINRELGKLPSAQPDFYDYSDIEPLWESFAKEHDVNLTDGAKQLKDAMWVGYRKGKQDAQPEIIRCKDCKHRPVTNDNYNDDEWDCGFNIEFPDYRCPCQCDDGYYNRLPDDDWFCGNAERRTDD